MKYHISYIKIYLWKGYSKYIIYYLNFSYKNIIIELNFVIIIKIYIIIHIRIYDRIEKSNNILDIMRFIY